MYIFWIAYYHMVKIKCTSPFITAIGKSTADRYTVVSNYIFQNNCVSFQSSCFVPPVISGGIFSLCDLNIECQVPSSECRDMECQCVPGLSYDPGTQTCVTSRLNSHCFTEWMDDRLDFKFFLTIVRTIVSGQLVGDNERLCAKKFC